MSCLRDDQHGGTAEQLSAVAAKLAQFVAAAQTSIDLAAELAGLLNAIHTHRP